MLQDRVRFWTFLLVPAIAVGLASCKPAEKPAAEIRPVRTVTVTKAEIGEPVVLTEHVHAQDEAALAFASAGE